MTWTREEFAEFRAAHAEYTRLHAEAEEELAFYRILNENGASAEEKRAARERATFFVDQCNDYYNGTVAQMLLREAREYAEQVGLVFNETQFLSLRTRGRHHFRWP